MAKAVVQTTTGNDKEHTWSYPPSEDGWYKAHNAIRYDMNLLKKALTTLEKRLNSGGATFSAAEAKHLGDFWAMALHQIHEHHDHEEQFFFPWMKERIELPERMTADHKTLMELMDEVDKQIKTLLSTTATTAQKAALQTLMPTYEKFVTEMEDHLSEEERVCVPLMRQAFTQDEANKVVSKMMKATMKPHDMAHFMHPMTPAQRKAFGKQEKIPWILTGLIVPFALRGYEKKYIKPMHALVGTA